MNRRDFIAKSAIGAVTFGMAGCSIIGPHTKKIKRRKPEPTAEIFKVSNPRPKGGTMPKGEIGTTGIKVSKFGFGSHLPRSLVPYEKERKMMIREAYDYGINIFDVYDVEQGCYQYEPMGRYLASVINDAVISIAIKPYDGRTLEEELERDLKVFGRDYIDMVRIHSYSTDEDNWWQWEDLFKYKKQGKIRAVGIPIHYERELELVLQTYPIDFVILPYNFYHNLLWTAHSAGDFDPLGAKLKKMGIGVVVMKPFASEWFISHFIKAAKKLDETGELSLPQAMLRYVINSGLNPDSTLGGMWCLNDLYENVPAYYNPEISDEEKNLLDKMRKYAKVTADALLPDHYKFLKEWVSDSPDYDYAYNSV